MSIRDRLIRKEKVEQSSSAQSQLMNPIESKGDRKKVSVPSMEVDDWLPNTLFVIPADRLAPCAPASITVFIKSRRTTRGKRERVDVRMFRALTEGNPF